MPLSARWLSPRQGCCRCCAILKSTAHFQLRSQRLAQHYGSLSLAEKEYFPNLHTCLVVNMKTVHRDGYYAGSIELSDMINRRCVKCCRADLVQSRTMRIRTGIIFWNLIFSMMFSCVKGTSLQYFFLFCFIFLGSGRKSIVAFLLWTCAENARGFWMECQGRIFLRLRSMQALSGVSIDILAVHSSEQQT